MKKLIVIVVIAIILSLTLIGISDINKQENQTDSKQSLINPSDGNDKEIIESIYLRIVKS